MASAFLSNPAATPIGFFSFMLQKVVFKLLKSFVKNNLFKKLNFKYSKEKKCALSGSKSFANFNRNLLNKIFKNDLNSYYFKF